jgi:hypothetical protein
MSSETIYFFMTLIVVTLAVRFIGPMMGRPRTPWRGLHHLRFHHRLHRLGHRDLRT